MPAALIVADEVAVGVVARPAEGRAGLAVVEPVADHAVGVMQLRLVLRLGPLLPHAEGAAGRCPAQEAAWSFWMRSKNVLLTLNRCKHV